MSAGSGLEKFLLADAIGGRLRLYGLPPSGPWDPCRLIRRTAQELEASFSHHGRGWVVLSVDELHHVLSVSHGIPAPIRLYISDTLLTHAYQKWEGTAS